MATRSVVTCTVGPAGSGKSFRRCAHFIINEFLPEHDGVHWSNFPLGTVPDDHSYPPEYEGETFIDRIANRAAAMHGLDEEKLHSRIQMIPQEELKRWETGESGPWDFFEGKNLQDAHIAIDEIHNFLDPQAPQKQKQAWRQWLGEIRHQGATVEFISQSDQKIAIELRRESAMLIELQNTETLRDPVFRIELGDWYELRAMLLRRYSSGVQETVSRSAVKGRGSRISRKYFVLDPWYFQFYDSYSKPQKGGNKGRAQRRQWQRRNPLSLLAWFVGRNMPKLAPRFALVAVLAWVLLFDGGRVVMGWMFERAQTWGERSASAIPEATAKGGDRSRASSTGTRSSVEIQRASVTLADALDQSQDAVILAELFEALRVRYNRLDEDHQILKAQHDELLDQVRSLSALVAVTDRGVTLRSGYTYQLGEPIDYGEYSGRKITAIDTKRRTAKLDDGTVLRLMRVRTPAALDGVLESISGSE